MRALVSILIPTYNAEECVGAAIGSALGQTGARRNHFLSITALLMGLWQARGNLSRMKFGS